MADVPKKEAELRRLIEVLDEIVDVKSPDRLFVNVEEKIDFLERATEVWRFYANRPENTIPLGKTSAA